MSNKMVSIIVVAGGKKDYLKSCLGSIKKQRYLSIETLIIDNSLVSNFHSGVYQAYPEIKFFPSNRNLFYCEALNKGIELSKGNFILCLNDDVILDESFIEEALKAFDIDERIGMVSGKILRSNGKTVDSTGLFLSIWRTAKERGYGLKDAGQFSSPGYIFGVNGAVSFYRRTMLDDIKIDSEYFDQDFRFFYEDLDIAWRAHNFSWKGYYTPCAIAYHTRGGTARQNEGLGRRYARRYISDGLHFDLIKNRYHTIIKNELLIGLLSHLPFILLYDIFVFIYIILFKPQVLKIFLITSFRVKSAFQKRESLRILKKKANAIEDANH